MSNQSKVYSVIPLCGWPVRLDKLKHELRSVASHPSVTDHSSPGTTPGACSHLSGDQQPLTILTDLTNGIISLISFKYTDKCSATRGRACLVVYLSCQSECKHTHTDPYLLDYRENVYLQLLYAGVTLPDFLNCVLNTDRSRQLGTRIDRHSLTFPRNARRQFFRQCKICHRHHMPSEAGSHCLTLSADMTLA